MERYTINNIQKFLRIIILTIEMLTISFVFHLLLEVVVPVFHANMQQPSILLLRTTGILLWLSMATFCGYNDQKGFLHFRYMLKWGLASIFLSVVGFGFVILNLGFISHLILVPLLFGISITLSTFPLRFLFIQTYKYRRLFFKNSRIMIIGRGANADQLNVFFKKHKAAKLLHVLNQDTADLTEVELLAFAQSKVSAIKQQALENDISEIYWNLPLTGVKILEEMGEFAYNNFISFKITSGFNYLNQEGELLGFINNKPIITLRNPPLASFFNRQLKRAFDLIFTSLVLIFLFPWILIVVGILIKLDSPGPVFFIQQRAGKKNQIFKCIKFRTMTTVPEKGEYEQATKNDVRITKIGAILRRNNIDEFPQFINVLLGDMSIVGPRPHPPKLDQMYVPMIKYYQYRYYIKPGISGWAQIHGYRGETKAPERMKKRVEYDNWYIENWDLLVDLRIVARTTLNMIKGEENAY